MHYNAAIRTLFVTNMNILKTHYLYDYMMSGLKMFTWFWKGWDCRFVCTVQFRPKVGQS